MKSIHGLETAVRKIRNGTVGFMDVTIIYTDTVCKCIIELHGGKPIERVFATMEEAEAYYKAVAARHDIAELTVLMIPDNGRDNETE